MLVELVDLVETSTAVTPSVVSSTWYGHDSPSPKSRTAHKQPLNSLRRSTSRHPGHLVPIRPTIARFVRREIARLDNPEPLRQRNNDQ